jgi:hypothetical protein
MARDKLVSRKRRQAEESWIARAFAPPKDSEISNRPQGFGPQRVESGDNKVRTGGNAQDIAPMITASRALHIPDTPL